MKRITAEMLKQQGACKSRLKKFRELFPKGASVSMRSLAKAQKAGLNAFFAEQFLDGPAWAEYRRATHRAWAEYRCAREPALVEDRRAKVRAWAEFQRIMGMALVAALKAQEVAGDRDEQGAEEGSGPAET